MANVVTILVRTRDEATRVFGRIAAAGGQIFNRLGSNIAGMLGSLSQVALKLAAVGTTAISAAPLIASAAKAVVGVGQAAIQAAPALAALAVAGGFVAATLKLIFAEGSAAREAIQPLADGIKLAGENASKAAADGLKPFVEAFKDVAWPEVNHAMVRIGTSVNRVAKAFLEWGKSTQGVAAINGILHPIWQAVERLEPALTRVAISFVSMLGRIMGVSVAAGESGLTKVLNGLADVMDRIDADSVSGGLSKLGETARTIWGFISKVAEIIGVAVKAYKVYQTEFGYVADAVALIAIAFGGPFTAIVAAIGLVIRHFDDLKRAWDAIKSYFTESPEGMGFVDALKNFVDTVGPKVIEWFNSFKEKVIPPLAEVGRLITEELVPALTDFINAAAPIVAWFVEVLGPVVTMVFQNIIAMVHLLIDIFIGLLQFFTGLFTGDWQKMWDGISRIFGGVWEYIKTIFGNAIGAIIAVFPSIMSGLVAAINAGIGIVSGAIGSVKNTITGWFKDAGSWLWNAGQSLINGLIGGIKSVGGSIASTVKSFIPGPVRGFLGFAHGGVVGAIAHAATGGIRGGLVEVGEHGRELVQLPSGSRVFSNSQSDAMVASGASSTPSPVQLEILASDDFMLDWMRRMVRVLGGNVQLAFGRS